MSSLLEAALRYAELGYAVFPCSPRSSRPLTGHGFKDATTNAAQIEEWWQAHPNANIGITTAGLLIVDVDGPQNPWLTAERSLELSQAPTARTPRGGWHFVFRKPVGAEWRCTAGRLAPHVDTRTDGGYIVVAPSLRQEGAYTWAEGLALDVAPDALPEPPAWLVEALDGLAHGPTLAKSSPQSGPVAAAGEEANPIPSGQRNSTLASLAGTMRRVGMSQSEVLAALKQVNRDRCKPPLSDAEVEKVAASSMRYEPDQVAVALAENWASVTLAGPQSRIVSRRLCDIEPEEISWLWPKRIPRGCLTVVGGRPSSNKSTLTLWLTALVTVAGQFPDGTECERGSALVLSAEDDAAKVIRPRFDAAGGDASRVELLDGIRRSDGKGVDLITLADVWAIEEKAVGMADCSLIVVDPIGSYLGGKLDAHRDNECRAVLTPLAKLAEQLNLAIVLVCHTRKSPGMFADDLLLGSRAFSGVARSVLHVVRDPEQKNRRLLLPGKCNLAPESTGLAFTVGGIIVPTISWESEPVMLSADELAASECQAQKRGPKSDGQGEAKRFLLDALADGPKPSKEIESDAREGHGIHRRTLERARTALGVVSFRPENPGPWYLRLPEHTAMHTADSAKQKELGGLGGVLELPRNTHKCITPNEHTAKLSVFGGVASDTAIPEVNLGNR
jgi:hypothetical protein